GDAVAKVYKFRLTGFPAWWVFRTVYLMKMPGLGRKVRVALDWTLDLIFRPEPVALGILPASRQPLVAEDEARMPTVGTTDPHPPARAGATPGDGWPASPDAASGRRSQGRREDPD